MEGDMSGKRRGGGLRKEDRKAYHTIFVFFFSFFLFFPVQVDDIEGGEPLFLRQRWSFVEGLDCYMHENRGRWLRFNPLLCSDKDQTYMTCSKEMLDTSWSGFGCRFVTFVCGLFVVLFFFLTVDEFLVVVTLANSSLAEYQKQKVILLFLGAKYKSTYTLVSYSLISVIKLISQEPAMKT